MRWPWVHQDILARLGALESAQHPIDSQDILGSLQEEIVALRARQDELEKGSVSLRKDVEQLFGSENDWRPAVHRLTVAVGEGIERVERDERRIKATVARAQKKLADGGLDDDGLNAEAHSLHLVDGDGGKGLPAVPEEVAEPPENAEQAASSIDGVPLEVLRRVRGY